MIVSESTSFDDRINMLNDLIVHRKNIVFFGGAGVSTESGIPDFRSINGLYNQKDAQFGDCSPEYLLSVNCLNEHPEWFYKFYRQKLDCRSFDPNTAHWVLAEMESEGKLSAIITQNIDGLHQKAGSKNVYEIHGTIHKNYCETCGKKYNVDFIFDNTDKIPICECGGRIRPDIVLYGEILPQNIWNNAKKAIRNADLLIISGTSLKVQPAASLIDSYCSGNIIVINRDRTSIDQWADIVFRENIVDVFTKIKWW